jgi:hypothetical protein
MEAYRAKAKEYARLTILSKSLRESRRYRKLAEMYWALALGEKPEAESVLGRRAHVTAPREPH